MIPRRRCRPIPATVLAALLATTPASAATWTWTGASGNNSWNNSGNWSPASPPANDGTADIIFGATPRLTPDLTLPWNVNSVTFNNTAGEFDLFSTPGNTLTIGAGGITNNDTETQDFGHALTLSEAQTWSAASGVLTISGDVNNGGNLLTIDASFIKGVYFYQTLSGSGGLTKVGPGILVFQGAVANTYAGTTTVNAGRMDLRITGGATAITADLDIGDSVGTDIDVVNNFYHNQIADSASVSMFSTGCWNLSDAFASNISETITNLNIVSTGIAGGGLVTVEGGTLTVLGSMTMTGGEMKRISSGRLLLRGDLTANAASAGAVINSLLDLGGGTRTVSVDDSAGIAKDLDLTGIVINGGILKNGPGTLRLGVANTYAGGTTLDAGKILIGHDSAFGTGPLTGGGGTLLADGAARTIANALNGSFAVDGSFDLTLNSPMALTGDLTKNGPGLLIFAKAGPSTVR